MKKILIGALTVLAVATSCNNASNETKQLFSQKAIDYIESVPFDVNRTSLYSAEELYAGHNNGWFILPILAGLTMFFSSVSLYPMEQDLVVDAVEDVVEDVLRRGAFGHQGFLDELGALLFHGVDAVDDVLDELFDVLLVIKLLQDFYSHL